MTISIKVVSGQCQSKRHKVGDVFVVDQTTPAGMCLGAWGAVGPFVTALRFGADFPWEPEPGMATIHCPDPKGITLELRRIQEEKPS